MKKLLWLLLPTLLFAAPANDPKVEKDLLSLMDSYKDAMIHNNAAVLGTLLHEDLTFVHSAGMLETKAAVLKSVTSGRNVITKMEFSDNNVRVLGNTALVKCRVDLWHSDTNIVHMNVLHVWTKGPAGWQLIARQATKLAR